MRVAIFVVGIGMIVPILLGLGLYGFRQWLFHRKLVRKGLTVADLEREMAALPGRWEELEKMSPTGHEPRRKHGGAR